MSWYVENSVKTGYETSFTPYFHRPQPLRILDEIWADIVVWSRRLMGCWARLSGEACYERA